jgi:hypothetical protein
LSTGRVFTVKATPQKETTGLTGLIEASIAAERPRASPR